MKAIAVIPGKPDSIHLRDAPRPSLDEVPGGRGVLVRVLRVGIDGTDREINAAEYGAAPPGDDYLILGHESFGRVEAVDRFIGLMPGYPGRLYGQLYHHIVQNNSLDAGQLPLSPERVVHLADGQLHAASREGEGPGASPVCAPSGTVDAGLCRKV